MVNGPAAFLHPSGPLATSQPYEVDLDSSPTIRLSSLVPRLSSPSPATDRVRLTITALITIPTTMPATVLPSTWRQLGLGVAVSYATFGLSGILFPQYAAQSAFGIVAEPEKPDGDRSSSAASLLAPLIGVRDLAIAATLAMLYRRRLGWEMGFVIVSRTVFCAADTLLIAKQKGLREYVPLCAAACPVHHSSLVCRPLFADSFVKHRGLLASSGLAVWLVIGFGLLSLPGVSTEP